MTGANRPNIGDVGELVQHCELLEIRARSDDVQSTGVAATRARHDLRLSAKSKGGLSRFLVDPYLPAFVWICKYSIENRRNVLEP